MLEEVTPQVWNRLQDEMGILDALVQHLGFESVQGKGRLYSTHLFLENSEFVFGLRHSLQPDSVVLLGIFNTAVSRLTVFASISSLIKEYLGDNYFFWMEGTYPLDESFLAISTANKIELGSDYGEAKSKLIKTKQERQV